MIVELKFKSHRQRVLIVSHICDYQVRIQELHKDKSGKISRSATQRIRPLIHWVTLHKSVQSLDWALPKEFPKTFPDINLKWTLLLSKNALSESAVLNWGNFVSQLAFENIWGHLALSQLEIEVEWYWHLAMRGQECCWTSYSVPDSPPHTHNDEVNSPKGQQGWGWETLV